MIAGRPGRRAVGMRGLRGNSPATAAVLLTAVTIFALLQALVIPVLPTIQQQLGTDARGVSWVLSAYLMAAAVATPIVGRIGDVHGKKRVLIVVLGFLAAGSLGAAFATDIFTMVIARIVQGAGGAVLPLALGIVREELEPAKAPRAIGMLAALGGIGASVGLVLAGPIVDGWGYRWLFLAPMILTVLTMVAAAVVLAPSRAVGGSISWLPAPFLALALVLFLLATTQATAWGWTDLRTIGLYLASVVFGAVWVRTERIVAHPIIDPALLTAPMLRAASMIAFLLGFAMFGIYAYVPQFVQAPVSTGYGLGASVLVSGLVLAPMAGAVFLGGLSSARIVARFGLRPVIVVASLVMAVTIALLVVARTSTWGMASVLTVYGFALGVNLAALTTLVLAAVPSSQTAVASAVNGNLRSIGGAVGAAAMATIVAADAGVDGLPTESGFVVGFFVLAGMMVLTAVITLTGRTRPQPATSA